MKLLIEKITDEFPEGETITQVLVNKYVGHDAFLPFHSDDEKTIAPNSSIYTLSLGNSCKLTFRKEKEKRKEKKKDDASEKKCTKTLLKPKK